VKLQRELRAWEWARHHAPFWNEECHADMKRSLATYLNGAQLRDIESVLVVERFCSDADFRVEQHRRLMESLKKDRAMNSPTTEKSSRRADTRHQPSSPLSDCECCHNAPAAIVSKEFGRLCARCDAMERAHKKHCR
jgi:hypothetical protein